MKERGILFGAPMVRAVLDDSKTQTRRVIKPQPDTRPGMECTRLVFKDRKGQPLLDEALESTMPTYLSLCPYGRPGDRLWVREAWARTWVLGNEWVVYREGDSRTDYGGPWKPSIHMFRSDSRILLEITDVRVERLQDISEADAIAEGITGPHNVGYPAYRAPDDSKPRYSRAAAAYEALWDQINGAGAWDANPLVWAVSFKKL